MLIRPTTKVPGGYQVEHMVRAATFLMFYMKEHMCYPGKVESMVLIIDLGQASMLSLPFKQMKGFSEVLTIQFRCQAARVFIVRAQPAVVWTWNRVKGML